METCANCQRVIGDLESAYLYRDLPICARCYAVVTVKGEGKPSSQKIEKTGNVPLPVAMIVICIAGATMWFLYYRPTPKDRYKPAVEPFIDALVKVSAESETDSLPNFQSAIADAEVVEDKLSRNLTPEEFLHHKSLDEFHQALADYRRAASDSSAYQQEITATYPDPGFLKEFSDEKFHDLNSATIHLNNGKDMVKQGN